MKQPQPERRATLLDVARRARVSPITASRALHGGKQVSPARRKLVLAAARALRYKPNLAARSLVAGKDAGLIVFVCTGTEYGILDALAYSLGEAHRLGLRMTPLRFDPGQDAASAAAAAIALGASGIILAETGRREFGAALRHSGSTVAIAEVDEERLAFDATDHLIRTGRCRIGMLVEGVDERRIARLRSGYAAAHTAHGMTAFAEVVTTSGELGKVLVEAETGVASLGSVDAVIAVGTMLAAAARHTVRTECEDSASPIVLGLRDDEQEASGLPDAIRFCWRGPVYRALGEIAAMLHRGRAKSRRGPDLGRSAMDRCPDGRSQRAAHA